MTVANRQLAPFAALSASYFAHIGFFNPYLPLWLKEVGLSLLAIGLLTSMQAGTRLVAPYFWGWLSDRTGLRTRWMRHCAMVATCAAGGLWIEWGLWGLTLCLLVMFLHTSAMMPLSEAALAHLVAQDGHFDVRRYGRVRLWGSLGFLLTVLLAGVWFERQGMQSFPDWVVLSLLAVVISVWWMPEQTHGANGQTLGSTPSIRRVVHQPAVRWLFATVFWHVLAHVAMYAFFSLYLDHLGYSKTVIGLLWAVSVVWEVGWFMFQGRWLPKLTLATWLLLAAGLTAVRMGMTAGGAASLLVLLIAQALHAITFAAHHTVCIALIHQHFPASLRGRGQALYAVVGYGLPGVMAGAGGGWVVERLGLEWIFWLGAAAGLVATGCAWRFRSVVSNSVPAP